MIDELRRHERDVIVALCIDGESEMFHASWFIDVDVQSSQSVSFEKGDHITHLANIITTMMCQRSPSSGSLDLSRESFSSSLYTWKGQKVKQDRHRRWSKKVQYVLSNYMMQGCVHPMEIN